MNQLRQMGQSGMNNAGGGSTATWQRGDECERLCVEADRLLERSRQHEDMDDLDAAFNLCQSAAQRARAAMDAPYNNPQVACYQRCYHHHIYHDSLTTISTMTHSLPYLP